MSKIKAFAKRPGGEWQELMIDNSLEALQDYVHGYIETVTLFADACIVCNEEGRIRGLPHNTNICGADFVGNILLIGTKGEEFCDVPVHLEAWKALVSE